MSSQEEYNEVQCESKKSPPPEVFWHFFQNSWEFFDQILHAYYAFLTSSELQVIE